MATPSPALAALHAAASVPAHGTALQAFRREMHADPEVGLHLPRTQTRVLKALEGLELEISTGTATSSVIAVLRGRAFEGRPGSRPTVLLRGDMDALPIVEQTGLDYASTNGAMHACGHDLHTAGLLGAARLLCTIAADLPGDVIFMFQPGEEGCNGAGVMLDEGVLEAAGNPVIGAYGVHMASDAPAGTFTTRPGSYMAAAGDLDIEIQGRGGHGSRPYQTLDPIQVAAGLVQELQVYVTRRFNVFDPVIVTVGQLNGGTARNVIPDVATIRASVRSFSEASEAKAAEELPALARRYAQTHGLTANAEYRQSLPPTINNDDEALFWADTATSLFGEERFSVLPNPKAGSEDFSRVLQRVDGAFGHVGAGPADIDPSEWAPLHSSKAVFDDSVLADNSLFLASLALRRLQRAMT